MQSTCHRLLRNISDITKASNLKTDDRKSLYEIKFTLASPAATVIRFQSAMIARRSRIEHGASGNGVTAESARVRFNTHTWMKATRCDRWYPSYTILVISEWILFVQLMRPGKKALFDDRVWSRIRLHWKLCDSRLASRSLCSSGNSISQPICTATHLCSPRVPRFTFSVSKLHPFKCRPGTTLRNATRY